MPRSSYNRWTIVWGLVILMFGAAIYAGTVYSTTFLNRLISLGYGSSAFLLTPTSAWWSLYAGALALFISGFPSEPVIRRIMGESNFAAFMQRGIRMYQFDCKRAMRLLALIILVPYTVFFIPSLGCHTRFSETDIGIQAYAETGETTYSYSQVERIALVQGYLLRSGQFEHDPKLVLDLEGGRRWTSRQDFRDPEEPDKQLISFLESRTGKQTQYARLEQELHP